MEGTVYLKARQEWDERYADLVLGEVRLSRIAGTAIGTEHGASVSKALRRAGHAPLALEPHTASRCLFRG